MRKCRDNLVECLFFSSLVILLVLLFNMIFARGHQKSEPEQIGEIFTTEQADSLFGAVISEKIINTNSLKLKLAGCEKYVMVNVFDGVLLVLNEKKEFLSETVFDIQNADVFHVFTIDKVYELLETGQEELVHFQQRENVLSIANGEYVLEVSDLCPPICFWQ